MKKGLFLLLSIFCVSCMGNLKSEKEFINKIVFETSYGAIRMNRRLKHNDVLDDMDNLSHYCIELDYEPYTKQDFIEEYGTYNQNFFSEKSRLYHTNMNLEMIQKLGVEEYVLDMSNYAPYIYLDMSKINEDEVYDFAYEIAKSSNVSTVFVSEERIARTMDIEPEQTMELDFTLDEEGGETTQTPRIPYDNYPLNCNLTGNGIKIGILDPSSLDVNDPRLSTLHTEVVIDTVPGNDGDHGLSVALVLGTQYGIASNASIYFADCDSRSNMLCLENLIDAGCDVINMSYGMFNLLDKAIYDASIEGYIDYIYNSTGIIMVAAAGNGLELVSQDGVVPLPASAANVIAVGSCDNSKYISQFSSCNVLDKIYTKPEIVAVGEVRNVGGYGVAYGTSYSAPAVTGTIALLLEATNKSLDAKQLVSLLTATANTDVLCYPLVDRVKNSSSVAYYDTITVNNDYDPTSGLYHRSGAGRLDISRAIAGLNYYGSYYEFSDFVLSTDATYILGSIYIVNNRTIDLAVSLERTAHTYWLLGTKYKSDDMPDYKLKIVNSSGTTISEHTINDGYFASVKKLRYACNRTDTYTFYLIASGVETNINAKAFCILN